MSRPSQLPPRCPLQKKSVARAASEASSCNPHTRNDGGVRHQKSLSQSSFFEDQPAWLDDLLGESDCNPKGVVHHRSASDSGTFFADLLPKGVLTARNQEEHRLPEVDGNRVESSCVYGPNSPRTKSHVEFLDSSALLALSDYVSQNQEQFCDDILRGSNMTHLDLNGDRYGSFDNFNTESSAGKRHPCQRSRARKLQYIAELERTVDVFQALESELSGRVSALLQQKVLLSVENNKLKQQLARLQKQKMIMDGEYQILNTEADVLKLGLTSSLRRKIPTLTDSSDSGANDISWRALDWAKFHL